MNVVDAIPDGFTPLGSPGRDSRPPSLPTISASNFSGQPVPEREFHDERGFIPRQGVTLLYGDGGTGKSLIGLQLAVATVTGRPWLGQNVSRGGVFYFNAEDPVEEVHIRLDAINRHLGVVFADLDSLLIASMAGQNCVMGAPDRRGIIGRTEVFNALLSATLAAQPTLIVIDNAIDVFGGDQNNAAHVKQFMQLLTSVSIRVGCPVVLLAHPSRSGIASGTGDAGSVHWSNSARSRLYLTRVVADDGFGGKTEDDPNARSLVRKKANYAPTGEEVTLRWESGVFKTSGQSSPGAESCGGSDKAERVFMLLLDLHERQSLTVSAMPGPNYAPSRFANHNRADGVSKWRFTRAMETLLERGAIEVQEFGPPSKRRSKLVRTEERT